MEQLERAVQQLEDRVGRGRKVEEEEKEEVVEVDMEEEKVKEEVEEKVVEEKGEVTGSWLRTFLGNRAAGAIMDMPCPGTPPSGLAPTPPPSTTPFSYPRRVRFGLSVL